MDIGKFEDAKKFETGWEQAVPGAYAEIKVGDDWIMGTVVGTPRENDRGIQLYAHNRVPGGNPSHLDGHGVFLSIYMQSEKTIRDQLRFPEIDQ